MLLVVLVGIVCGTYCRASEKAPVPVTADEWSIFQALDGRDSSIDEIRARGAEIHAIVWIIIGAAGITVTAAITIS